MSTQAWPRGLLGAFAVQNRVIGALVLRELHTRFGRENIGYLWMFMEPALLGGCITIIHEISGIGLAEGHIDLLSFYMVGYVPYYMARSVINRAASALESNRTLLYHRQVTFDDIMISRSLLEGASCVVVTIVAMFAVNLINGAVPADLMKVLGGIALMLWFSHGLALIVAGLAVMSELVERIIHILTYLWLPVSGAFTMVDWLPVSMGNALLYSPTVHMYELIREGQFGLTVHAKYDIVFMLWVNFIVTLLGLCMMRVARPRIIL